MVFLKRSFVKILLWLLKILASIFDIIIGIDILRAKRKHGRINALSHVLMRVSNIIKFLTGERYRP